ncbi:hypothetical protein AADZ90_022355 [Aestuariibius sp. 2305UL40-4]|uniref:hypothetical protein n=1 Tax=Aestuariibius violaceus TaxID=3234132 RepID=UPI00345E3EDA
MSFKYTVRYKGFRCSKNTEDQLSRRGEVIANMGAGSPTKIGDPYPAPKEGGVEAEHLRAEADDTILWESDTLSEVLTIIVSVLEEEEKEAFDTSGSLVGAISKIGGSSERKVA